jgi:hypothetical protein
MSGADASSRFERLYQAQRSTPGYAPCCRPDRKSGRRRCSVALNRAIAVGEVHGPAAALALVEELDLGTYHPFHATRADLLRRLGRDSEAAAAYQRAAELATTDAERDFLQRGGRSSR